MNILKQIREKKELGKARIRSISRDIDVRRQEVQAKKDLNLKLKSEAARDYLKKKKDEDKRNKLITQAKDRKMLERRKMFGLSEPSKKGKKKEEKKRGFGEGINPAFGGK